jgi:prevent-host-death family protein
MAMLCRTIDIDKAKSQFADLITFARQGGEVIIKDGKPLARLVPIAQLKKKRIAGLNRGTIWTSADFDELLPDEFWMGKTEN